jgi:predicted DNA-binding transcriptional regulator YafY
MDPILYSTIIRLVEQKRYTREELSEALENMGLRRYNNQTISRHISKIQNHYGVVFRSSRGENPGFVIDRSNQSPQDYEKERHVERLADLELIRGVGNDPSLEDSIQFGDELIETGSKYLTAFKNAIVNRKCVQFDHYNYFLEQWKFDRILHPYLLKESNYSWYVFGEEVKPGQPNQVRLFALDRIKNVRILEREFRPNPNFPGKAYFANRIGVSGGAMKDENGNVNEEVRTVKLRLYNRIRQIVKKKKIHPSQVNGHEQHHDHEGLSLDITLSVMINWDLIKFIKANAGDVKVLEPIALRDMIKDQLEAGAAFL